MHLFRCQCQWLSCKVPDVDPIFQISLRLYIERLHRAGSVQSYYFLYFTTSNHLRSMVNHWTQEFNSCIIVCPSFLHILHIHRLNQPPTVVLYYLLSKVLRIDKWSSYMESPWLFKKKQQQYLVMSDYRLVPQPGVKRSTLLNLPLPYLLHIPP